MSNNTSDYIYKRIFDEDLIYEHINERYAFMAENTDTIKQDLGIIDAGENNITIEIEYTKEGKEPTKRTKKKRNPAKEHFAIELEQLPTSLKSNTNGNSTTGFVVWQSAFFFINWVLKEGGKEFLGWQDGAFDVIELGTGVNCTNSIVISNFTNNFYICTDQKGILNKLKRNCLNNMKEIKRYNSSIKNSLSSLDSQNHQLFRSKSLDINSSAAVETDATDFRFEVLHLDWCEEETYNQFLSEADFISSSSNDSLSILAVDVIYNEFLIVPFVKTLKKLLSLRKNIDAIIVLQLRDESIILDFLSECLEWFNVAVIEDRDPSSGVFSASRHVVYRLTTLGRI